MAADIQVNTIPLFARVGYEANPTPLRSITDRCVIDNITAG